ncbi:MAG: hypothetical protein PHI45_03120 [Candidatus Pacebacteria bacterium]|nr:hypothetical protein [Candidatus Paceibacterota bacterium]MDD5013176.1 hypothetical protein [Candidatus Paceibacterota bacterium]MDD5753044.1 hypothetical protein [Candidatus Paceibacterota bacterium]
MAKFSYHDCTPTVQEIEEKVEQNGGSLMGFGGSFCCPGKYTPQVGGWEIRLVDKRGCGNEGLFVAIATTPETYAAQMAATKKILRKMADKEEERNPEFLETNRGDIGCEVIPLIFSQLLWKRRKGTFLFSDEKWLYFSHSNGNYLRVGDDRERIWVKKVKG